MAETRDETIAQLRKRLSREPTKEEIEAAREAVIRRAYADMAMSGVSFLDEGDPDTVPHVGGQSRRTQISTGAVGPACVGSETKPSSSSRIDLTFRPKGYFRREKEVVIADIFIDSTLTDATQVRARQAKDRIRYEVIDEYGGETLTGKN